MSKNDLNELEQLIPMISSISTEFDSHVKSCGRLLRNESIWRDKNEIE